MKLAVCVEPSGPGRASRAALHLAERLHSEMEVILLSLCSDEQAQAVPDTLRGLASRIVCVHASRLRDSSCVALGQVLAQAARHVQADVILAGEASDDEGSGLIPASVAHALGAALLCSTDEVALDPSDPDRIVIGLRSAGRRMRVAVKPPVVLSALTTQQGVIAPLQTGPTSSCEMLTLAQLGLDPASLGGTPKMLGKLERVVRRAEQLDSVQALLARWLSRS